MSQILPSKSETSITDSSLLSTCRDLGIRKLLLEIIKPTIDSSSGRYVCSRDGDHPFIGRNLLIAYLTRILADGEEGQSKIDGEERIKLINDLSIYCYLKIPAEKQIDDKYLLKLREETTEERIGVLWRTTLLNSGWNTSPKHSIAQGWLFLDQYWDVVAAKHVYLAGNLTDAKSIFLKELYLAAFSYINSGIISDVASLEKESVFSVATDIDDFVPFSVHVFPTAASVLEYPLKTLQVIREQPYLRISAAEAITVNPEQIFNDVPVRAMRRVIARVCGSPGCTATIPKLRGFFGELYEEHANRLLAQLGTEWTPSTKLSEGILVVPEFNMTPDDSEHLSPDCLLLADSHIAFEHKFRELWGTEGDLDEWIWRPLEKPSLRHNPAQLIEFSSLWKSGNTEIVRRYGEWRNCFDFKYLFVFHDAPAWLNSDEFRQYLKRKYPDCDQNAMDHVFFTDIRNIEILSGIYSNTASRNGAPLVTQLIREWATEQANQGVVTARDNTVKTPDDLIEYMTKKGIYKHKEFLLPRFMQVAFNDCFDTLLESMGFDPMTHD